MWKEFRLQKNWLHIVFGRHPPSLAKSLLNAHYNFWSPYALHTESIVNHHHHSSQSFRYLIVATLLVVAEQGL